MKPAVSLRMSAVCLSSPQHPGNMEVFDVSQCDAVLNLGNFLPEHRARLSFPVLP